MPARQQPGADTPLDHIYGRPPSRGYAPSPAQVRPPGKGSSFPPARNATPMGRPAPGAQWLLEMQVPAREFDEVRPPYACLHASEQIAAQIFWSTAGRPFYVDSTRRILCAVACERQGCPMGRKPCDKPFKAGTELACDLHSTHLCSHCKAGRD